MPTWIDRHGFRHQQKTAGTAPKAVPSLLAQAADPMIQASTQAQDTTDLTLAKARLTVATVAQWTVAERLMGVSGSSAWRPRPPQGSHHLRSARTPCVHPVPGGALCRAQRPPRGGALQGCTRV